MSQFVGTWDFVSSDNMDKYLSAMGVGFMLRKVAGQVKPRVVFERDGKNWTISMTSTFKNQTTKFTEEVPFEEVTLDGRNSTNVVRVESDTKMVQEQTVGDMKNTIVREIVNGQFVQTLNGGGVTASRTFNKV